MARFDATAKHLIEGGPRDWLVLAGLPVPKARSAVRAVDADLSTVTSAPDKLVLVGGTGVRYIAHVEFQSARDRYLDGRILLYNVLARKRHGLPVRSIVFLLRPAAASPRVTGGVRETLDPQSRLEFDYRLIRVWELPVEQLLTGGLGTLPLAPISAVTSSDLPAIVGRVRDRLANEAAPAEAAELWTATGILMSMCYRRPVVDSLLKGARTMRESWLYQGHPVGRAGQRAAWRAAWKAAWKAGSRGSGAWCCGRAPTNSGPPARRYGPGWKPSPTWRNWNGWA